MNRDEISKICSAVADKYLEFEPKSHFRDVLYDFVRKGKVPFTVSYFMYQVGINCDLIEHHNVGATQFSSLLIV